MKTDDATMSNDLIMVISHIRQIGIAAICLGVFALIFGFFAGRPHHVDPIGPWQTLQRMGISSIAIWIGFGLSFLYFAQIIRPAFGVFLQIAAWYAITYPLLCVGDVLVNTGVSIALGILILHMGLVLYMATARYRIRQIPASSSMSDMTNVVTFKREK